jgi:hypothetical protein
MAGVQCREDSIEGASFLPDKKGQWGLRKESKGKERLAAADRASRRQDCPRRLGGSIVSARV